jgi:hypothetical protein
MPACFPTDTAASSSCTAPSPASAPCGHVCLRTRAAYAMRMRECACERARARLTSACMFPCACAHVCVPALSVCVQCAPRAVPTPGVDPATIPMHWRVSSLRARIRCFRTLLPSTGPCLPTMAGAAGFMLANSWPANSTATSSSSNLRKVAPRRSLRRAPTAMPCYATQCHSPSPRAWAHPCYGCIGTGLGPATSAPGLGSPVPPLHRDWARPCHICAGTAGLAPALELASDWS